MVSQRKAPTSAAGIDGKPASLVFFEGATRVHGLFEHLLFEAVTSPEQTDIPLLVSPVPFLGASLQQLHAQVWEILTVDNNLVTALLSMQVQHSIFSVVLHGTTTTHQKRSCQITCNVCCMPT